MSERPDTTRTFTITSRDLAGADPRHAWISTWLVIETLVVFLGLGAAAVWLSARDHGLVFVAVVLQGVWFQRLYGVGHEAAHRKLFPHRRWLNDAAGQLALLPIAVPVAVFRKIHEFHHGHNRRDLKTSAIDTFVIAKDTPIRRSACILAFYLAVFAGGFFLHSLVSIVLFLCLPLSVARKVSPAFRGWTARDRWGSVLVFAVAVAIHVAIGWGLGVEAWAVALGWPFLVFALVYSALLYVYHYDTGYGPDVRTHVRSLRAHPWVGRWLLHINEHEVHHGAPAVPWYQLPVVAARWAAERDGERYAGTVAGGILAQLRGPKIVVEAPR
jgi:fatty acid desaturase